MTTITVLTVSIFGGASLVHVYGHNVVSKSADISRSVPSPRLDRYLPCAVALTP